jgi:hypothetical protein
MMMRFSFRYIECIERLGKDCPTSTYRCKKRAKAHFGLWIAECGFAEGRGYRAEGRLEIADLGNALAQNLRTVRKGKWGHKD